MSSTNAGTGLTSYKSVYRSAREVEALLTRIYGPSLILNQVSAPDFSFRTATVRDDVLALSDCSASNSLRSSFHSENNDIVILTRLRGEFAIHTDEGTYAVSHGLGFVFTMNYVNGYTSVEATATSAIQIRRSAFDAVLRQYMESAPDNWSGIRSFSLSGGFGQLMQSLSTRYRENFDHRTDHQYSDASLKLIRCAACCAIAELISREADPEGHEKVTASRRNVMRAVDLINAQTEPLTIHDLATTLDISVRALQDGFRKHLNTSPHNLLKTGRIEGAWRDLNAGNVRSVREAAAKWGFSNIARFNQEYFATLGYHPKDTLRVGNESDNH